MSAEQLLWTLNDVLGGDVQIHSPGVRDCLSYFVKGSVAIRPQLDDEDTSADHPRALHSVSPMDFGQAYAHWRTVKNADFTDFLRTLGNCRIADDEMRRNAVQGTYISNAQLPPRRVWDLFSNRVVPSYLVPKNLQNDIPRSIWTVSHGWCHPTHRHSIETPINAYQWPVPIPGAPEGSQASQDPALATTLEHVRVELLNHGAEYVWQDILCVRQVGSPENEALRAEEWRTDIPMIGRIYNAGLPCVTYFNGLGLPLKLDAATLRSDRHWLNRVWTLQEGTGEWLCGGATATALATREAEIFFQETLGSSVSRVFGQCHIKAIQERHCTSELDRVHGLAYVAGCDTHPIYDLDMTPDHAWVLLLKHLGSETRGRIATLHTLSNPDSTSFLPSFEEFKNCVTVPGAHPWVLEPYNPISIIDELSLGDSKPGTYFHSSKALGTLSVLEAMSGGDQSLHLKLSFTVDPDMFRIYGQYCPHTEYDVVSLSTRASVVVEVVGKIMIEGKTAQKVVKRGCIHWNESVRQAYTPYVREKKPIVYVPYSDVDKAVYNVYD
ncbi:hypothetical protein PsYK624_122650 [Phanerochaete sordida]|uniref:Heterokaryon incompatibility domain-containing protein n=1 Tax=Phanerochaete sordida TaxID=48140 RepID=A0A9P3LJC3_9APHY|nr:hypothetical protein PsYK624_122650 [Phanerochaete sordida]